MYNKLTDLLNAYNYEAIACEQQFLGQNPKTAIKLVRPTGVVLAATGTLKEIENIHFDFLMPSSWRNMYRGSGVWNKKNTYEYTLKKYPDLEKAFEPYSLLKNGKVSQPRMYKNCNDMTDAIGLAHAALVIANDRRTKETT